MRVRAYVCGGVSYGKWIVSVLNACVMTQIINSIEHYRLQNRLFFCRRYYRKLLIALHNDDCTPEHTIVDQQTKEIFVLSVSDGASFDSSPWCCCCYYLDGIFSGAPQRGARPSVVINNWNH